MDITVLTPEEEIIAWFQNAILEEMTEIIQAINEERGERWIEPITEITLKESNPALLPKAFMEILKVKKKTVDINFTREEYLIRFKITFKDNEYRSVGYRYNYVISKLVKESADLQKISDSIIIDELTYNQNKKGDNREPSTAEFKIIITRETA